MIYSSLSPQYLLQLYSTQECSINFDGINDSKILLSDLTQSIVDLRTQQKNQVSHMSARPLLESTEQVLSALQECWRSRISRLWLDLPTELSLWLEVFRAVVKCREIFGQGHVENILYLENISRRAHNVIFISTLYFFIGSGK